MTSLDTWPPWKQLKRFKGTKFLLIFTFGSPGLTILVPVWFIIIALVFSYLSKVLFLGFLQLKVILSMVKIT